MTYNIANAGIIAVVWHGATGGDEGSADTGRGNRPGQLYVPDSSALVALANLIVSLLQKQ